MKRALEPGLISGAVLNGGRSSRFGSDKSQFVWRGKTLLEHSLGGLAGCAERFVVGGAHTVPGVPLHPDPERHGGSLYGVHRALEIARQSWIAVTACDMPQLGGAYWAWVCARADSTMDVVLPLNADGRAEPFAGLYAKRCLPMIQSNLERGQLRASGWWQGTALRVQQLEWAALETHFGAHVFLNVNTPADLERL